MPDSRHSLQDARIQPAIIFFHDPVEFERGRTLLSEAGLLYGTAQPGGMLGALRIAYGFPQIAGRVFVTSDNLDHALEMLDQAGIAAAVQGPPLIDPDHPACSFCGHSLQGITSDICPECGEQFIRPDLTEIESQTPPSMPNSSPRGWRSLRRRWRFALLLPFILLFFSPSGIAAVGVVILTAVILGLLMRRLAWNR